MLREVRAARGAAPRAPNARFTGGPNSTTAAPATYSERLRSWPGLRAPHLPFSGPLSWGRSSTGAGRVRGARIGRLRSGPRHNARIVPLHWGQDGGIMSCGCGRLSARGSGERGLSVLAPLVPAPRWIGSKTGISAASDHRCGSVGKWEKKTSGRPKPEPDPRCDPSPLSHRRHGHYTWGMRASSAPLRLPGSCRRGAPPPLRALQKPLLQQPLLQLPQVAEKLHNSPRGYGRLLGTVPPAAVRATLAARGPLRILRRPSTTRGLGNNRDGWRQGQLRGDGDRGRWQRVPSSCTCPT